MELPGAMVQIHPLIVRITHWVNASHPHHGCEPAAHLQCLAPFPSGSRTSSRSGWLAGALQWHFAACGAGAERLAYVTYGSVSPLPEETACRSRRARYSTTCRKRCAATRARGSFRVTTPPARGLSAIIVCAVVLVFRGWRSGSRSVAGDQAIFGGYENARWCTFSRWRCWS